GLEAPATAQKAYPIDPKGGFDQWSAVEPTYREMTGDISPRSFRAYDAVGRYENHTGRNEFEFLKVAADGERIHFFAQCTQKITPPAAENWMTLYLKIPALHEKGWEGYSYVINRRAPEGTLATVEKADGSGEYRWKKVGNAEISVDGNRLMLSVRRETLGLPEGKVSLEFKWSDNLQAPDVMDFYQNGDAAPRGRMNWLFETEF
ncbi:MAG TPA: hypothetical protein DCE08_00500, partial [Ruminococcaceae bacterium]|nr:hypothetical protein [Oscillospiraceae bacterium]